MKEKKERKGDLGFKNVEESRRNFFQIIGN